MEIHEAVDATLQELAKQRDTDYNTGIDLLCAVLMCNPWYRSWGSEYAWCEEDQQTLPVQLAAKTICLEGEHIKFFSQSFVRHNGKVIPRRVRNLYKDVTSDKCEVSNEAVFKLMEYVLEYEPCSEAVLGLIRDFAAGLSLVDVYGRICAYAVQRIPKWEDVRFQLQMVVNSQHSSMVFLSGKPGIGKKTFMEDFLVRPIRSGTSTVYVMELNAMLLRDNPRYSGQVIAQAEEFRSRGGSVVAMIPDADDLFRDREFHNWDCLVNYVLQDRAKMVVSVSSQAMGQTCCVECLKRGALEIKLPEMSATEIEGAVRGRAAEFQEICDIEIPEWVVSEAISESQKLVDENKLGYSQPKAALKVLDLAFRVSLQKWSNSKESVVLDSPAYAEALHRITVAETPTELLGAMRDKRTLSHRMNHALSLEKLEFEADCVKRAVRMLAPEVQVKEKISSAELKKELGKEVLGQDEAIEVLCKTIRRLEWGVKQSATRGSFMFVGPTATGKTELSKQLAKKYFDDSKLIQFDMSEFSEPHTVSRLIGSPPGYVGSNEPSLLLTKVTEAGEGVLLFDEIEKADKKVHNLLLQLMEEGRVTDSTGHPIDCSKFFVILTSNTGIHDLSLKKHVGFQTVGTLESHDVLEEIKKGFTPEFINRLDGVIPFKNLSSEAFEQLVRMYLGREFEQFKDKGINLRYTEELVGYLKQKAYSTEYGVRYLKRSIESEVVDVVLDYLEEQVEPKGRYTVGYTPETGVTVERLGRTKTVPADSIGKGHRELGDTNSDEWLNRVVDDGGSEKLHSLE